MPHVKELRDVKRVYLIGICGTAMASLAGMLQERGYEVGGSDEHVYPPMSTYLQSLGIPVLEGYTKQHLETFRPDLVIVGNAAASTNVEAAATVELDLPYTSMPEAIYELFIKGKHSLVVTGTHGKTTTTSLMAWMLQAAGRDPSMVVGGIPLNFNHNFKLGDGPEFVIEGDEYNTAFFDKGPKFAHYRANTLIVNNIEFDHADIYANLDAIIAAFRKAVQDVAPGDVIIANGDDANVGSLRNSARARWFTFGLDRSRDIFATDIEYAPETTSFTAWWEGREWFRFTSTLSGRHNVLNALANIAAARLRGVSAEELPKGSSGGWKCAASSAASRSSMNSRITRLRSRRRSTARSGAFRAVAFGRSSSRARSHQRAKSSRAATSMRSAKPIASSSVTFFTRDATKSDTDWIT